MNLIETLTKETESLKKQYIEMTIEWAKREFPRIQKAASAPRPEYNAYVKPPQPRPADYKGAFWIGQDYAGQKRYRAAVDRRNAAIKTVNKGIEVFIEKAVKNAELHYEQSILKLAARIQVKGLKEEALRITTSHIGVNIDTVLTDGEQTVKAFTIIASGPIQRPHYRYLVK